MGAFVPIRTIDITQPPLKISAIKIKNTELLEIYKNAREARWLPDMVTPSEELQDWQSLMPQEQVFVLKSIAFLATSEKIINEDLDIREKKQLGEDVIFIQEKFFRHKAVVKDIHQEMYSKLFEAFTDVNDPSEKLKFDVQELPVAHEMALWTWKWACCRETPINLRVVAMAASEHIFTSIPLAAMSVFQKDKTLTRLAQSVELITKDKIFSVKFLCALFKTLGPTDKTQVHTLLQQAVNLAKKFFVEDLKTEWMPSLWEIPGWEGPEAAIEALAKDLSEVLGYDELRIDPRCLPLTSLHTGCSMNIDDDWKERFHMFYRKVVVNGKIPDSNAESLATSVGTDFLFVKHWCEEYFYKSGM